MPNYPNDERSERLERFHDSNDPNDPSVSNARTIRHRHPVQYNPGKITPVRITLNGDPYELEQPVSVQELLERLNIDPRRVAVEHNMVIVKRHAFAATLVGDGDQVEIVNFVGGGCCGSPLRRDGPEIE